MHGSCGWLLVVVVVLVDCLVVVLVDGFVLLVVVVVGICLLSMNATWCGGGGVSGLRRRKTQNKLPTARNTTPRATLRLNQHFVLMESCRYDDDEEIEKAWST